jgi:hypothetical protein
MTAFDVATVVVRRMLEACEPEVPNDASLRELVILYLAEHAVASVNVFLWQLKICIALAWWVKIVWSVVGLVGLGEPFLTHPLSQALPRELAGLTAYAKELMLLGIKGTIRN